MQFHSTGRTIFLLLILQLFSAGILSAGSPGEKTPVPDFTLTDIQGQSHTLSEYKGKWIVLEWSNPNCPFVVRHYGNGDMQALQARWRKKDVVWLTINSTNRNHRDFMTNEQAHAKYGDWKAASTAILVDPDGRVGHSYGAKTTPHLFVIDRDFTIAYQGAVDSDSRGKSENRINYIDEALNALTAGKTPEITSTQPYGCSVKYGN